MKSVSSLIAVILLIVVAVIIVLLIQSWGRSFVREGLNETQLQNFVESDATNFLEIGHGINGRFIATYRPPVGFIPQDLNITYYKLVGLDERIPLDPPVTITANNSNALDLGIVDSSFNLVLYLDNNTIITKLGLTAENRSPATTSCPTGYIPVPGNYLYQTTNGDTMGFCVAEYEMKVDTNSDGIGDDANSTCDQGTNLVWYNSNCDINSLGFDIVSSSQGYPIAGIVQDDDTTYDAKDACSSLGANYHLITNNEWMTIARNIERVSENWNNGIISSGQIKSGNTGVSSTYSYDGANPESGEDRNTLARLKLTNNQYVWDIAGNLREWADQNIMRKDQPEITYDSNGDYYIGSKTINTYGDPTYELYDLDTLDYKDLYLIDKTYNSTESIGKITTYSDPNDVDTTVYGFTRGAGYSNGASVGIIDLYLSFTSSSVSVIGFRCAYNP